jgi:uncharacterized protein (TIGR02001 family)
MKLSNVSRGVFGLFLLLGITAIAQADGSHAFTNSANVTFTSDYMFRGVSQTSSTAAVQGGLTINHVSGLYASIWGSSISFANMELDPSLGFSRSLGDVTYDVGVVHYGYPGYTKADLPFTEGYGSLSWKGAKLGVYWTDNYFGKTDRELYTYLSYGTEVAGVSLSASVGQSKFRELTFNGEDSYVDYSLSAGKSFAGLSFGLSFVGSNMDKDDCAAFSGDRGSCGPRAVASVSKSM